MTPEQERLIATLLVQMPWANLFPVEREAIAALRDDRDDLKRIVDRIASDEDATRIARLCRDPAHDPRWCSTCEKRDAGIEDYRAWLQSIIDAVGKDGA